MTNVGAEDWKPLLTHLNWILLNTDRWRVELSSEALSRHWCGEEPASDFEIQLAEKRLGISLPPSYREFLMHSNGWRPFSSFIEKLSPVQEIERFSIANPTYLANIQRHYKEDQVTEAEYLDFENPDRKQALRHRYYADSLVVGTGWEGGNDLILLNPQVVSAGGEWEAIFFANWVPGNIRFRSFLKFAEDSVNSLEDIEASRFGE